MDNPSLRLLVAKMQYHSARQSVLSANIANANTPKYQAVDVKKPDFAKMLQSKRGSYFFGGNNLPLANTHKGHLKGFVISSSLSGKGKMATYEKIAVENDVSLDQQIFEASQNNLEYSKAVSTYRKATQLMKIAISGNSGAGQ